MNYIVKQKDIDLLLQSDKTIYYKLELLNEDLKVVDLIEGNLISDSISITSDSDVRRTYNAELFVSDSSFNIGADKKLWFWTRIRPYIGIRHIRNGEIVWYLLGTFLFTESNFHYDATSNSISLTCNDMMCLLNGSRNGHIDAYKRTILAGTDAREVIIELLKEVGIKKYFIEFNLNNNILSSFEIPYDMIYNAGMNVYQIIKDIVDLYPGNQMYFDLYGTFIISNIPTKENEQIVLNDELIQPILINEQLSVSFTNVYNHIEIWGKVNEPDYYSKDVVYSDGVYNVNLVVMKLDENTGEYVEIEYTDDLDNFDMFSIKVPHTNLSPQYVQINSLEKVPIVKDDGSYLEENYLVPDTDYVFRYRKALNDFLFIGQYQCYANLYVTNDINDTSENAMIDVNNEFSVERIGDKLKVLSGQEVENIYTDELCRQRCRYELYNSTNRQDNVTISIMAVPWLDVNQVIEFTSNSTGKKDKYIINNISCNYAGMTMSVTANRYYAEYIG